MYWAKRNVSPDVAPPTVPRGKALLLASKERAWLALASRAFAGATFAVTVVATKSKAATVNNPRCKR